MTDVRTYPAHYGHPIEGATLGLRLSVFRNLHGDFTNRGVTSLADEVTLVGLVHRRDHRRDVVDALVGGTVFPATDKMPPVVLRENAGTVHLVPAVWNADKDRWDVAPGWFMFGGNYAATSDSRLGGWIREMLGHSFYGAIAVHDRQE